MPLVAPTPRSYTKADQAPGFLSKTLGNDFYFLKETLGAADLLPTAHRRTAPFPRGVVT
jgi:hypothetical protein